MGSFSKVGVLEQKNLLKFKMPISRLRLQHFSEELDSET